MINLIPALIPLVGKFIDKFIADPQEAAKAKLELLAMQEQGKLQELDSAVQVIVNEARSESWLTRTWRPIVMLWLMALLTMWMLGLAPPAVDAYIDGFLRLLTVGVGGYVFGRSAEKFAADWKGKREEKR